MVCPSIAPPCCLPSSCPIWPCPGHVLCSCWWWVAPCCLLLLPPCCPLLLPSACLLLPRVVLPVWACDRGRRGLWVVGGKNFACSDDLDDDAHMHFPQSPPPRPSPRPTCPPSALSIYLDTLLIDFRHDRRTRTEGEEDGGEGRLSRRGCWRVGGMGWAGSGNGRRRGQGEEGGGGEEEDEDWEDEERGSPPRLVRPGFPGCVAASPWPPLPVSVPRSSVAKACGAIATIGALWLMLLLWLFH
jgi:hypothetical protein